MRVSVVRPDELTQTEIGAWHAMQEQSDELRNPFLCPEFAIAVGRSRPDGRVAVLTDGSSLAGFFPFERGKLGVGRPIGAGLSDCQGLVRAAGADADARDLLSGCGISVWHFDHLVSDQQPFASYQVARAASPVIDLRNGYQAYADWLRAKSPRFVSDLGRKVRKLEREAGPLRFEVDVPDIVDLHTLMRWKSDQYRRTGRSDRFDQPWIVDLVENLFECDQNGFRGLLSMLYAGGKPVAGHFGLVNDGVFSEWFPAYDPAFAKYSPGLMQLVKMTEDVAGLGVRVIDLGKGDKQYKDALKSYELSVGEGTVTGRSALAAVHRARLAPPRWAVRQIRAHKPLFDVADRALKQYGRLRVALRGRRLCWQALMLVGCGRGWYTSRVHSITGWLSRLC
jgi:CelD/BcsL family acetyltransferase involved in cellulose biosynthesis